MRKVHGKFAPMHERH